jgi:hypothetical protein
MTFAYFHGIAFVQNNHVWMSEKEMNWLLDDKPLSIGNLVQKHYDKRFSPREAETLDRYRENIKEKFCGDLVKTALAFLQVLHYVMDRCFLGGRLNNGQVLADLQHRIGHSRNRGNDKEMNFKKIPIYNLQMDVQDRNHLCFNEDAIGLLRSGKADGVDLCYIDPPYGSDQSDYTHMYEFFERYIRGDYDFQGNDKKFVATSEYSTHFLELLDAASKIPVLVFSYNDSSWSKVDEIVGMIRRFRKKVTVEKVDYPYKYREQRKPAEEYIILAE